jgi:hypothetical protein
VNKEGCTLCSDFVEHRTSAVGLATFRPSPPAYRLKETNAITGI